MPQHKLPRVAILTCALMFSVQSTSHSQGTDPVDMSDTQCDPQMARAPWPSLANCPKSAKGQIDYGCYQQYQNDFKKAVAYNKKVDWCEDKYRKGSAAKNAMPGTNSRTVKPVSNSPVISNPGTQAGDNRAPTLSERLKGLKSEARPNLPTSRQTIDALRSENQRKIEEIKITQREREEAEKRKREELDRLIALDKERRRVEAAKAARAQAEEDDTLRNVIQTFGGALSVYGSKNSGAYSPPTQRAQQPAPRSTSSSSSSAYRAPPSSPPPGQSFAPCTSTRGSCAFK